MNTVKRWLAGFLSFAMIFTGAGLSQLGTVATFAATTNYDLVVKDGAGKAIKETDKGMDPSGYKWYDYETKAAFGDDITLSAETKLTTGTSAKSVATAYEWSAYTDGEKVASGKGGSFTFNPAATTLNSVVHVDLKVTQSYTVGGENRVDELDGDIDITLTQKEVEKKDIETPGFNKVYSSKDTLTYAQVIAGGVAYEGTYQLLEWYADETGTWEVLHPEEGSATEFSKKNTSVNRIALRYTLDQKYKPSDASEWDEKGGVYSFETTQNIEISDPASYVKSIEKVSNTSYWNGMSTWKRSKRVNSSNSVDLYYNEGLATNANYKLDEAGITFEIESENIAGSSVAGLKATTSDPALKAEITAGSDANTFDFKLTAVGVPEKNPVTVTITDKDGFGVEPIRFTAGIYVGVTSSDVKWADIPKEYVYKKGAKVSDIFDGMAANNKYDETNIWYYTNGRDDGGLLYGWGSELDLTYSPYKFVGVYDLATNENAVKKAENGETYELNKNVYWYDQEFETVLYNGIIDEAYITEAVNSLKFDGVALNGGTVQYGVNLVTDADNTDVYDDSSFAINGFPGVEFGLYVEDETGRDDVDYNDPEATPDLGKYTTYTIYPASVWGGYKLASGADKYYPISFEVVKADFSAKLAYSTDNGNNFNSATGAAIQPEVGHPVTTLQAQITNNSIVTDKYTFAYAWYEETETGWTKLTESTETYAPSNYVAPGKYYCEITASAKSGTKTDVVNDKVFKTAEVEVLEPTAITVARVTAAGTTEENANYYGSVVTPTPTFFKITAAEEADPDAKYQISDVTVSVRKNDKDGEPLDVQTFDGASAFTTQFAYTVPATLDSLSEYEFDGSEDEYTTANSYSIWVSATVTTTKGTKVTTSKFNKEVSKYGVNRFDPDEIFEAYKYEFEDVIVADNNEITYGEIPSSKIKYACNVKKLSGYDADALTRINDLMNANYTFTIAEGYDVVTPAGTKPMVVVVNRSKEFSDTNIVPLGYGWEDEELDVADITVNKAPLTLAPEKEAYEWVIGGENEDIKGVYDGFVNGDTAEKLGLDSTYDVYDGETKINISNIKPGEYTVQMKATEQTANYAIEAKTAKLTVLSPVQKDADEFIKKIESTDLTDKAAVDALLAEYDKLSKGAQALVDESDAKKALDAAKANFDAVAAAQAAVAKATAAGATDADIADAQAKLAALTDAQKAIYGKDALDKATADVKKAADGKQAAKDQEAANKVIEMLSKITDSSSQADAKAAVDAYNALTAAQKALVDANATAKANLAKAQTKANTPDKTKTTFTYKNSKKTIKASKVKKKAQKFTFKAKAKSGGKVTYKKASGSKKVTISKKGKVTVKKGTKKGTYKIKVKVTAAAKGNFLKTTVKKQITVKVK